MIQRVHWGALGVALIPFSVIAAELDLPKAVAIAGGATGGLLVLFALELPQRTARRLSSVAGSHLQRALEDRRLREALRLCRKAADTLDALLPADLHASSTGTRFPWQRGRQILTTYDQLHRAAVVHAIEAGLSANASHAGTLLALARHPRDVGDLHMLQSGLLRMAFELDRRLHPAEAVVGESFGA